MKTEMMLTLLALSSFGFSSMSLAQEPSQNQAPAAAVAAPATPPSATPAKEARQKLHEDRVAKKDAQKVVQEDKKKLAADKAQNASPEQITEDINKLKKDRQSRKELHAKVMQDRKEVRKDIRAQHEGLKNQPTTPATK